MMYSLKKLTILCSVMVSSVSVQLFCAEKITFSAEQNGIKLDVVDCAVNSPFYSRISNIGTPLVPGLGVQDFTQHGMHPIRISIRNTSTKPVIIAPNSFRMKLADLKNLNQLMSSADEFLLPVFFNCFGAYFGGLLLLGEAESQQRHVSFSVSNYPVACSWISTIVGLSVYTSWSLRQNRLKKIQKLEKYFLSKQIVIEPGKTVQKLVLLDGASFHSFFQFRVFNHDQTEYAATFDIELMA